MIDRVGLLPHALLVLLGARGGAEVERPAGGGGASGVRPISEGKACGQSQMPM